MPMQATTFEHTHQSYRPLSALVAKNGFTPKFGEWGDRCTLKFKKHTFEFALGSDSYTVDGKTGFMEAFVARKKGDWMIPKKVLAVVGMVMP